MRVFFAPKIGRIAPLECRSALAEFVRTQRHMIHQVAEVPIVVGHRPAEGAECGCQDFDAIEIGAHMVEYAM